MLHISANSQNERIPIMETQLETFRKSIETSPSYMVEQFVLLHSNYLDAAQHSPQDSYTKYKEKIAAIQALCAAALEHTYVPSTGGKAPQRVARATEKLRKNTAKIDDRSLG